MYEFVFIHTFYIVIFFKFVFIQTNNTKKTPGTPSKRARLELLASFSEDSDQTLPDEIESYLNSKVANDVDLVEWWKANSNQYPHLSQLANIYFGIPATSASSERAFSTAGNTMTAKRSGLHPTKLQQLTFIHDNFEHVVKQAGFQNVIGK